MKKVGIVCDNYKVKSFKEKLNEAKLVIFDESKIFDDCTLIRVMCNSHQIDVVYNICLLLEIQFKQSN